MNWEEIQNKIDSGENPTAEDVWNAAIEEAALEADNVAGSMAANAIRKLKK